MIRKLVVDCPCEEASPMSRNFKIDCGVPAVGIVWHNRDQKAYPMCEPCLVHNIQNRGGILLVQAAPDVVQSL